MTVILLAFALLVAPAVGQEPNQPARIIGRVVSAETGRPVPGAMVELLGNAGAGSRPNVYAGTDGRFELFERRVGRYALQVSKAGYVPSVFGLPGDQTDWFDVLAGQSIDRGTIKLQIAAVISGRVQEAFGDPIADAFVTAWRLEFPQPGIRSARHIKETQTNDLGEFRLHGLMPGTYLVSARRSPALPTIPDPYLPTGGTSFRPAAELFLSQGGSFGSDVVTVQTVRGGEAGGTNITLPLARYARVNGSVLESDGRPASSGQVTLRPVQPDGTPAGRGSAGVTIRGGRFEFANVPLGDYRLTATVGPSSGIRLAGSAPAREVGESAAMSISVRDDVQDLIVQTTAQPIPSVSGRVFVDGAQPQSVIRLRITVVLAAQNPVAQVVTDGGGAVADRAGRFVYRGFGGLVVFGDAASPDLRLKSVTASGADVTDGVVVTDSDVTVDVHLTSSGTVLSGLVKETESGGAGGCDVILFSPDSATWKVPLSRRVMNVRADDKGAFHVTTLPPGPYLAIALRDLDRNMWADPDRLEQLRPFATPFTLIEGTPTELKLEVRR